MNISCRFDPKQFAMTAANRHSGGSSVRANDALDPSYMYKRKRRSETKHRRHDTTLYEKFVKQHHKPHRPSDDYQLSDQHHHQQQHNEKDDVDIDDGIDLSNAKYEIDWYFSDNKGRMNIISYGNKTSSNLKYKIYTHVDSPPPDSSSLSALYSQQLSSNSAAPSSSSRSSQLYKHHHHNQRNHHQLQPQATIHFLNVLIESENDEGFYQCLNPDWPNFVIRNITVLVGKSRASSIHYFSYSIYVLAYLLFIFNQQFITF